MTEPDIGQQILHYRVIGKLGQGGMGAVYMAEDTKLHRKVALKFLPAEMIANPERLRRFEREARTVAALNHPNIVTIYSVEEDQGVPFIAMELVEGQPLSELIPSEGLPLGAIFDLAIPIADAVSAAHEKGISHRDLKPGNIMMGSGGRVKVLDFGLAKLLQESQGPKADSLSTQALTKTGHALGTVTYMAPEQLKGKAPDQRADIFSLGIVLYQMASGQRPFQGETSAEVISSILRDAPPAITDLKIELPSHLGRIVKRCLEKNPNHRYQTAAELRSELQELRREVDSGAVFEEEAKTRAIKIQRTSRKKMGMVAVLGATAVIVALLATLGPLFDKSRRDREPGSGEAAVRTIAVLPFSNVGEIADPAFSEGLNEELASLMTSLPGLQVVSRATARRRFVPAATTHEIGEALGADFLVLGSVRWGDAADQIPTARATLQVVRVEDDIQIWSERFNRRVFDPLAVQTEIAQHAVRAVGVTVLGLTGDQLPPAPEIVEPPQVADELTAAVEKSKRAPPQPASAPSQEDPSPQSSAEGEVVEVDAPPAPEEDQGSHTSTVELEINLKTFEPEGVLTIHADDNQVLSEEFHFEGRRKGILGRKKSAGSFAARQSIPAATRSLRVYVMVGNETHMVTLQTDFGGSTTRRLQVVLTRKGELEANLL